MVIEDASALPLPGTGAELRAATTALAADNDQHRPKSQPTQAPVDIVGEAGRAHLTTGDESLAEFERDLPDLRADDALIALADTWFAALAPGALRRVFQRVL